MQQIQITTIGYLGVIDIL